MDLCKKKQKKVKPEDKAADREGTIWGFVAQKPKTKLHLAHHLGKPIQKNADKFIRKIKRKAETPTSKHKATFLSDRNRKFSYLKSLRKYFPKKALRYAQYVKVKDRKGRLIEIIKINIIGRMRLKDIHIANLENYNNVLRQSISRLVRETLSFSKCFEMLENHLDIYQAYRNFVKPVKALKKDGKWRTPMMAEGITDAVWSWKDLIMYRVPPRG